MLKIEIIIDDQFEMTIRVSKSEPMKYISLYIYIYNFTTHN